MKQQRPHKSVPRISDAEWEVMRIVWAKYPLTGNQIIEKLDAAALDWHPKTVRTLLARLVRKKALSYQADGRCYVYSPLVSEQQCVAMVSDSFVDRVFGGSLRPMLAHFAETQKITKADLAELRELLEGQTKTSGQKSGGKE
ncbi:MAG: BlaI/MecI/CopY family transcriptional regulator [Limisphaerales bacterium]